MNGGTDAGRGGGFTNRATRERGTNQTSTGESAVRAGVLSAYIISAAAASVEKWRQKSQISQENGK